MGADSVRSAAIGRPAWQLRAVLALLASLLTANELQAQADESDAPEPKVTTVFRFGGYGKLDVLGTAYRDGDVEPESPLRDIHIPAAIPLGADFDNDDLDFHVKESRFHFGTETTFGNGRKLTTYIELDFMLSKAGDERVSNSFNPRLRHFYATYDKWLFGQTWSTFMIVTLPDDLDFAGAAEGIVFNRQPMVRFTTGNWQFALENPESTATPFEGGASRIVTESGRLPDVVARYNFAPSWGSLSVAGILRGHEYEVPAEGVDENTTGFGATVGGRIPVGTRDDIRFQLNAGKGLGRYLAMGSVNGVMLDAANRLHALPTVSGFVAYLHHWNDQWRSSVNFSALHASNDTDLTSEGANAEFWSASANVLYSPVPPLTIGLEFMHAERKLESGVRGRFDRLQFSARYDFDFTAGGH